MRKPIVGISYKTYINTIDKASSLAKQFIEIAGEENIVEQFVFPSLGVFPPVANILRDSKIGVGAQNISPYAEGPYTGEISILSIKEQGGGYIEIGHAERKRIFNESLEMINLKTVITLESGLIPVLCIGEEKLLEENKEKKQILKEQISASLQGVAEHLIKKVILAYEPVWAIGQAEAADASYVHQTHLLIREILADLYGVDISEEIRIIYGGSVSKDNAEEIINDPNVDGVFIGRFGHDPANYKQILDIVKDAKLGILE